MPDFITLTCPSCGGDLQITNDKERFACEHCGRQQMVRRNGGTVSLEPIAKKLEKMQTGVDKVASELAIQRLEKEIPQLKAEIAAVRAPDAGLYNMLGGLGLLLGLGGCVRGVTSANGVVGLIFGIVCIIGAIAILNYSISEEEKIKRPLKDKLRNKQRQMEEHRRIVSM